MRRLAMGATARRPPWYSCHMSVVSTILGRHGLSEPDGRPLFAYQLEPEDLDALRTELRRSVAPTRETPRAFCLAAAEIWRRTYDGGAWSWTTILDEMRWPAAIPEELPDLVLAGLAYWRRPLLRLARREFLGSIAREAGIPAPVLHTSGARIRIFLQHLLADLRTYGSARALELARRSAHRLPERLRNPTFLAIGTDLALAAIDLAQLLGSTTASVAALDHIAPAWRERLPLRIDDAAALALVTGLVDEARRPPTPSPLRVLTRLVPRPPGYVLTRSLRLPPSFDPDTMSELIGSTTMPLPPRMDVLVETTTGPRLVALLVQRGQHLQCEPLDGFGPEPDPHRDFVLALRSQGRIVGRFVPPGGRALSSLPWVFTPDPNEPETLRLVAQGSTRFDSEAFVLAPSSHLPRPALEVREGLFERRLYRVTSDVIFGDGSDAIALTQGASAPEDVFFFDGRRLPEQLDVFIGMPTLWRVTSLGDRRAIPRERLEVRTSGSWRPLGPDTHGRLAVRLRHDGALVFSDTLDVLPPDFRLRLHPLSQGRGRVVVETITSPHLGVTPAEGLVVHHVDARTCELEAGDAITAFELALRWAHGALAVRLPFPRRGLRFVTTLGQPLAPLTTVALDDLYTIVAEAWVHPPVAKRVFQLEASLQAEEQSIPPFFVGWLDPSSDGRHALPLHALERQLSRLLALSSSARATVRLRMLDEAGSPRGAPAITVGRFPSDIQLSSDKSRVTGPSDLTFEALRFTDPELVVPLPLDAPGESSTSTLAADPGSWMIFARRGDRIAAPPRLLLVPGDAQPPSPLRAAMELRSFADRKAAFVEVLDALVDDPESLDWALVQGLIARLDRFPLTTFEALRVLTSVPAALVRSLALSDDPRIIVRAFESVPFHWATLPVDAVARALRAELALNERLLKRVSGLGGTPAEMVMAVYGPVVEALSARLRGTATLFAAASASFGPLRARFARPEIGLARSHPELLHGQMADAFMELRRRFPIDEWPPITGLDSLRRAHPMPTEWARIVGPSDADPPASALAEAPLLAALAAARRPHCAPTPYEAFALRLAESFDPDYFVTMHELALTLAVASWEPRP